MNEKLLEAISAALPEIQVKTIKEALVERDQLREEAKNLKTDLKEERADSQDLRREVTKLTAENSDLTEQIEKTIQSNIELMAKDVENRVTNAQGELAAVERTVDKFLKNTIYRETKQREVVDEQRGSSMQYGSDGRQVPTPYVNKTHKPVIETTETEAA